ncbi:MAG: hypothetical protein J6D34_01350 [Atopobiaceae bacterium]|nr:hypothetical protein [Atopobiaceae bacterium]
MARHTRATAPTPRHAKSFRLLAALAGLALTMSLTPTAWAATDEHIRPKDGETVVVDDDVVVDGRIERAALVSNDTSTETPTTVDVSGSLDATGTFRGIGAELSAEAGCETKVNVSGNISGTSQQDAQGAAQRCYGSIELHVGGDVESTIVDNEEYGEQASTGFSASAYGSDASSTAEIKGSISSTSNADDSYVDGMNLNVSGGATVAASVGGDVSATTTKDNRGVTGITTLNQGGAIGLEVGGSVIASSPTQTTVGIKVTDDGTTKNTQADTIIRIHGDVNSTATGVVVNAGNEFANYAIVIEGVLRAEGVPVRIIKSGPTIDLAVGAISTPSDVIALERDEETWTYQPTDAARAFAAGINYLVRIDPNNVATKQVPGGTISVVAQGGEELRSILGQYDVARANEVIWVRVTPDEGYVLDGVFNGDGNDRVELVQDGEGNYLLEVPALGGIYLSALFKQAEAPAPAPEPAPTHDAAATSTAEPARAAAPAIVSASAQKVLPATGDTNTTQWITLTVLGGCLILAGALCRQAESAA